MTILKTTALNISIAGKPVCKNLDLSIEAHQCWGILGRNGAGKTTLLHTLAALRPADGGEIILADKHLPQYRQREWAQHCGVLFQDYSDTFPATVFDTAMIGRHPHIAQWQWETEADRQVVRSALRQVGLDGMEQRGVNTLSGGERRRLAIATLLAQMPQLMLLDEPANHLDLHYQITLLDQLTQLIKHKTRALMLVLHDVNLAARFCDHVLLLLDDGETLQGPSSELLNAEILSRVYGHPMKMHQLDEGRFFVPQ